MLANSSNYKIEPNKCIIEDLEILAFESEEEQKLYTIWHEALLDERRELEAQTERERILIRKHRQSIVRVPSEKLKKICNGAGGKSSSASKATSATTATSPTKAPLAQLAPTATTAATVVPKAEPQSRPAQSNGLPNGLTILNTQNTKHLMRYKLTKLYNKYRGRQLRRNFVIEKQRNSKIEAEISRSYLNPWLTYTALQALRLPETNVNTLNTTTNNNTKILTPMAQQPSACSTNKKAKTSSKKQHQHQQQTKAQAQLSTSSQSPTHNPPMHLVYIDPGNIITYSNRINPQQVAEYKQKSHLLPSSATSKKSSAASYDVYEIMEVLANTNKTNVTITRNANRPSQGATAATSIYSHSVNANTPGIVSTQLHLQARSYRDSMRKFYTEEIQRLEQQREELDTEPDHEELISRYLKI